MSYVDVAIVIAYLCSTLVLGFWFRRRAAAGLDEYFLGGRKIPWWVLGASGTASNFDMTGTMVIVSFFFALGLQGFWVAMRGGMCLPLGILMIYMGKWLRRSHVMTTAEWMELRFGSGRQGQAARLLSAISNLVVTLAMMTYFVKGTGKFIGFFLDVSPELGALLLVAVALLYTTLSGFRGVIFTDLAQELLIVITSVYVGIKAFSMEASTNVLESKGEAWRSFAPLWEAPPMNWLADPAIYHLFGLTIVFWIARGLLEGAGGLTGGYMPQRYYAARDDRSAGLMTAQWVLLLALRWALIAGVAVMALVLANGDTALMDILEADPEKALPVVLGSHLIPAGLRGLAIAGLIAAAMSTFDSTLNAGASYWVRDIYHRYINRGASESSLVRQGYLATVALAATGVFLGQLVPNIDSIWSWITGPLSAGLFAPIVLRWYWERFNGYGFAISTIAGLVLAAVLRLIAPGLELFIAFPLTWGVSLVAGILGSLLTEPTDESTLVAFWNKVRPFGLWPGTRARCDQRIVSKERRAGRSDLLNVPLAVIWHLSGVVTVISLVIRNWGVFPWSLGILLASGVLLYFTWFRALEEK